MYSNGGQNEIHEDRFGDDPFRFTYPSSLPTALGGMMLIPSQFEAHFI